jgi:hypothetical protein
MKITLTESEFVNRFVSFRPENFSRPALRALFSYLTELEQDCGEEIEFDAVAICCDWTEYSSVTEAAEAYGFKDESEEKCLDLLRENTSVIELESGILVMNF